ncbi:gluconokinase [Ideonella margarita]|uniref:Gluconokinase n=1 Tax=Ideonella margarita TaxID=2984191 RepID=A0ABU9C934_9BURK
MKALVVMGVSGCGKSSLGAELAQRLAWTLVEGDDFHPPSNMAKMQAGQALNDADRASWLATLGGQLAAHPNGVVLTCSSLKRAYREQLRSACAGLGFVHLQLTPDEARQRVAARPGHPFPPSLVDSQFAALEDPAGEPRVLSLSATRPLIDLAADTQAWIQQETSLV